MDASTKMQPVGSLIDSLKALITPDVVSKASSVFGESEAAVTKGFGAALPTVLGALANKATDRSFMSNLFDLIKEPAADGSVLGNITNLLGSGASSSPVMSLGSRFLSMLFGGGTYSIGNALSSFAGVKPSTGSSIPKPSSKTKRRNPAWGCLPIGWPWLSTSQPTKTLSAGFSPVTIERNRALVVVPRG